MGTQTVRKNNKGVSVWVEDVETVSQTKMERRTMMYSKCPYCGKRVKDIPDHLEKTKRCKDRHSERLFNEMKEVWKNRRPEGER
jgi:hypothetical protein